MDWRRSCAELALIDFLLTDRRDAAAAERFFRRALLNEGNQICFRASEIRFQTEAADTNVRNEK